MFFKKSKDELSANARKRIKNAVESAVEQKLKNEVKKAVRKLTFKVIFTGAVVVGGMILINSIGKNNTK